jgi:hypothetical protein
LYIRAGRESLGLSTTLFLFLSLSLGMEKKVEKGKQESLIRTKAMSLKGNNVIPAAAAAANTQKTQERERRRRDGIWWIEQGSPLFWNTLPI